MTIDDVIFVYQMKSRKELQWHGRKHAHLKNQYEIHYFLQGEGTFSNHRAILRIAPGSLHFSLPEETHAITATDLKKPLTYYAVLFYLDPEDTTDRKTAAYLKETGTGEHSFVIGSTYRFFFEELRELSRSGNQWDRYSAGFQFLSLLYRIPGLQGKESGLGRSNHHIEKALKILQSSVFQELSLEELAAKLQLSEPYLIRLFKNRMRITPMKYFMKLRIEAAASMLINTDKTIYEIASTLRFSSEFHLSKAFKQHKGIPPRSYRDQYYQNI